MREPTSELTFDHLNSYAEKLKNCSINLRSKLTSLLLYTEQAELKQEEVSCILNICDIITKKNNELIFTEEKLQQVIQHLSSKENTNDTDGYAHF